MDAPIDRRRCWNCGEINHIIDNCLLEIQPSNIKRWKKVFEKENSVERIRRRIKSLNFLYPVEENPYEDWLRQKCEQARIRLESKSITWKHSDDDSDLETLVDEDSCEDSDTDTIKAFEDESDFGQADTFESNCSCSTDVKVTSVNFDKKCDPPKKSGAGHM
ncbi:unnamed protein product [Allacma fusca]|uniref:CCHC-type domain-containing protein n=1 Tax=Allacma fusca TaxID=39272 RepID=A0A8J2KS98_9HEXA|nr:unnamed protein product [Allacma fusca]